VEQSLIEKSGMDLDQKHGETLMRQLRETWFQKGRYTHSRYRREVNETLTPLPKPHGWGAHKILEERPSLPIY